MTVTGRATCARELADRARENSAYLHRLLSERQPEFSAALLAAEGQVDLELSGRKAGVAAVPESEEP